ncbi:MAG: hypothetical protein FJX36_11325 [Alphaproteobacteria bacterium]|nr:hypothetical protein [Alphaproteobacteria bacterium]
MIGLFGLYRPDPRLPADASAMAATLPEGYAVARHEQGGAALCRAAHPHDGAGYAESADGRFAAIALGEIFGAGGPEAEPSLAARAVALAASGRLRDIAQWNGLFSLAIHDRAQHRLTLATDRHASFPIHVWRSGGELVFAGQIRTLLGDARVPRRAEPGAIAQLFTTQRTFGRATPIAGIEALPAGCLFAFDGRNAEDLRHWTLAWRKPDFTEAEGATLLAAALRRAATRQTAGRDIGLLLSGGIDSRLILAAAPRGAMSTWTTASFEDNPELANARALANALGAAHHALIVPPPDTLPVLERTVVDSNGLYPASTPMSAFLPRVGAACRTILTGHGLDFTLRGYYLPARFVEIMGSRTRLPMLRPIPGRPTGADVLRSLRQGPPLATVERIAAPGWRDAWWSSQARALDDTLKPWLESAEPYDAWDAFILHALSKHYAFTGMMATRAVGNLRMPAFDNEVFDIYLRMPPAWRCSARMVKRALVLLSPAAGAMAQANTGFRADLDPRLEIGALLGRAALRRLGLAKRAATPTSYHSAGSWQNIPSLYKDEPGHRRRFVEIKGRLDALTLGVLDAGALARCIDEHLEGHAKHTKLLRQLLTHDAWVREFGIAA